MTAILVRHALGAYPVYVRAGALADVGDLVESHLGARRLALVTDANVAAAFPDLVRDPRWAPPLVVPPGEAEKTRETWARLTDALLDRGLGRDSALLGVGGGVVGDLTGFVAATYQRGVPFLLVPTTLLAMLDASVGGKTGVDTPHGKNLIGAFHPPAAVVIDPAALRSLPEREFRAGLAEAVKHGLIADAAYFAWMEAHADAILARDLAALAQLVTRSVEIKADVVMEDEREAGRRATLNAGHTMAHAIEQVTQYAVPHGEAVAIGLVAECAEGERLGRTDPGTAARVAALLERFGLPTTLPAHLPRPALLEAMRRDKKNRAGTIRCAFPARLGVTPDLAGEWTAEGF